MTICTSNAFPGLVPVLRLGLQTDEQSRITRSHLFRHFIATSSKKISARRIGLGALHTVAGSTFGAFSIFQHWMGPDWTGVGDFVYRHEQRPSRMHGV
jgi:hypothetical protein